MGGNTERHGKQRYTTRIPVTDRPDGYSRVTYILPIQFQMGSKTWVAYQPANWWDEEGNPKIVPGMTSAEVAAVGRSFDQKCAACHFTGAKVWQDEKGEWVSTAAPVVLFVEDDRNYIDMNGDGI